MATSDFALLTVENTGGALALKRKNAAEVVPEAASPVYGSVTGSPAVLPDAAGERVLRSVVVNIEPQQAGSGDPSPDNVRAITGFTGAHIARHGRENLIDFDGSAYLVKLYPRASDDTILASENTRSVVIPCLPNTTYTCSKRPGTRCNVAWTKTEPAAGAACYDLIVGGGETHVTITTGDDAAYLMFYFFHVIEDRPVTLTEMKASLWIEYADVPEFADVEFPSEAGTVYGGVLDLTAGTLTVDRYYADGGSLAWTKIEGTMRRNFAVKSAPVALYDSYVPTVISSQYRSVAINAGATDDSDNYVWIRNNGTTNHEICVKDTGKASMTAEEFKAAMSGVQFVFLLQTPVVYTLTPVQIAALAGYNAVWADCGPVSVEYVRDTGMAIDAGDADTRAMIGEASGETASRSLAVGEYVTVGDKLYRVTSAVGSGETLVPGTNVTETTVGAELARIAAMIS